jgi:competence protein ComEC
VLSPVWAGGAALLVRLAAVPTWWLVTVARHGAAVPGGTAPWPGGRTGGLLLATALLVAGLLVRVRAVRHATLAVSVAVAVTALPIRTLAPGWPPAGWVMVVCDVGQGDALVLHAAARTAVVVDTGPEPVPVDRCLRRLGVARIPLLVLTHLHADHVGGLAGALRGRSVGQIEVGPLHEPAPAWTDVTLDARRARIRVIPARVGQVEQVGQLRIETLAPSYTWHGTHSDPNNSSIVLRVTVRGRSLLLPGDTEVEAQQALVAAGVLLRADVLKVPHHGSRFQDPRFLAATGAALALVSVGVDNDYGHPSARTLALLRGDGARVLRTDRDGDLAVCVDGAGRLRAATRGVDRLRRPAAAPRGPPLPDPPRRKRLGRFSAAG